MMLTFLLAALAQTPAPAPEPLAWLAGCWSQSRKQEIVEEQWTRPAFGALIGMGRTLREGRMQNFEFMRIAIVNGKLSFMASPAAAAPITFPVHSQTAEEVVFENLTHDFPQRIIYRKSGEGLFARVEGRIQGVMRSEEFNYRRCAD